MTAALLTAELTSLCADINHRLENDLIGACAPRCERSGSRADVGTVEIQSNALCELLDGVLAQTRIRARCAGLGAVIAGFNTTNERIVGVSADLRVRADDLLSVHSGTSWLKV
jgi:hypothetical protein